MLVLAAFKQGLFFRSSLRIVRFLQSFGTIFCLGLQRNAVRLLLCCAISSHRMLLEHGRYYGLGMDALRTECNENTDGIMVWAWLLCDSNAMRTRTVLWFGHGCFVTRMQ